MEGRAASGTDKLEGTQQSLLTATCNSQSTGHSLQDAFPDLSACGQEPGSCAPPHPSPAWLPTLLTVLWWGDPLPAAGPREALSGCRPQAWLCLGHTLCLAPPPNSSGALEGGKVHFSSVCPEKEEATRKAKPPHIAHSLGMTLLSTFQTPYSGAILLLKPPRRDVAHRKPGATD